ncbi:hypothetical protein [Vibrio caribbeanicus]|uniref:hypothetical protein n=1 Tax=Vibrio caribbeanicus TaxID=701175 RepID=UPI002284F72D|nr:hypothetical protein [Vibrio caribbeanicus]MCY9844578.1 hypothetical protein [Vibrio caribbeanicus]
MNSVIDLAEYICKFIIYIRPEYSSITEVPLNDTLDDLGIESMDIVELQVCLLDEHHFDLSDFAHENIFNKTILELSELIFDDICQAA